MCVFFLSLSCVFSVAIVSGSAILGCSSVFSYVYFAHLFVSSNLSACTTGVFFAYGASLFSACLLGYSERNNDICVMIAIRRADEKITSDI